MPYKYKEAITKVEQKSNSVCYEAYREKHINAFRWVFADINDERNFIPMAKDKRNYSLKNKCEGWALSFHNTKDASLNAWNFHITNRPEIYLKLGTHLAEGTIDYSDGKADEIDSNGHFNLIEYKNTTLVTNFQIVEQIASKEQLEKLNTHLNAN